MKKIIFIVLLIGCCNVSLLAQAQSPLPIVVQVQAPEKDLIDYVLFTIQALGVIGLFLYVYKTWQIASANKTSAEASQKSIELSQSVLKEMKASRIQEISPHVIVYFDMPYGNSWIMFFVIKNIGKMPAKDIELVFNPPLQTGFGNKISDFDLSLTKDGISLLAPEQEIRTPFDAITNYFDSKMVKRLDGELPTKYEIEISYSNLFEEERICLKQIVDFSMFRGLSFLEEKGTKDLIKAVETISDSSKRIERSLGNLSDKIVEGIWIKNSEALNLNSEVSVQVWKLNILGKLDEFKVIWQSIHAGAYDKPVKFYINNLQSKLSLISSQLVTITSKYSSVISSELNNSLITIAVKLTELSEWRFYHNTDNHFNAAGDELVNLTNEVIKKLTRK
jgi:hypothetical protein